jgi:hypothetical protein
MLWKEALRVLTLHHNTPVAQLKQCAVDLAFVHQAAHLHTICALDSSAVDS